MVSWTYKGESFNPESVTALNGFIYKLTYEYNDKEYYYYGQKSFNSKRKKYYTKKEMLLRTDKRLKNYYYVTKESDWRNKYLGSCKDQRIEDMILVDKEILKIIPQSANAKINLTYWEVYYIMVNNAIIDEQCLNANILNSFFRGRIE